MYATMGMPTDKLDEEYRGKTGHVRAFELYDIETEPAHRRKGHATALLDFVMEWLGREIAHDVPLIFARDASDVVGLYERWGWYRLDEEGYEHVVTRLLG